MRALRFFEILGVTYETTQRYIPGDFNLEQHCCGKLKPRVLRVSSHVFKINRAALLPQDFA